MKNISTPRTLAQCQFYVGHAIAVHPAGQRISRAERIYGVILAVVLGVVGAAMLWHWAAQ